MALNDRVEIFKDCCTKAVEYPYLRHNVHRAVADLKFVPYEDVMGIGHGDGFSSILVPGAKYLPFTFFVRVFS